MLVTKLSSQFDYGHLKGWKSKIYATTVLDSFQDRKGINPKMTNNYQVIGLYSMKYRSNKRTARTRETCPLPSRVFLARLFHLGPKWHSWVCYEGYQDVIILFLFQASAMAQIVLLFFGSLLLALSLSQEMSPRCLQLAVQKTNGCSVPAGLWAPYKNTFTPACYKHDFCYFCVSIACLVNTN